MQVSILNSIFYFLFCYCWICTHHCCVTIKVRFKIEYKIKKGKDSRELRKKSKIKVKNFDLNFLYLFYEPCRKNSTLKMKWIQWTTSKKEGIAYHTLLPTILFWLFFFYFYRPCLILFALKLIHTWYHSHTNISCNA